MYHRHASCGLCIYCNTRACGAQPRTLHKLFDSAPGTFGVSLNTSSLTEPADMQTSPPPLERPCFFLTLWKIALQCDLKRKEKEKTIKIHRLPEINPGSLSPCLLSVCLKLLPRNCRFSTVSLHIVISVLVCSCSTMHTAITWSKQA